MKSLYITMASIDETSGVFKKIRAQAEAMKDLGSDCSVLFINDSGASVLYDLKDYTALDLNNVNDFEQITSMIGVCDYVYVRFELLRHTFYRKLVKFCSKQPAILIVEIPTYPPYQESLARVREKIKSKQVFGAIKTLLGTCIVITDMYRLVYYSDIMCMIADDKKFFNRKTVRIENGVDLNRNAYIEYKHHDCLNVIAVSNFAVWNGYDRAINGLKNYVSKYGQGKIHIYFVGEVSKAKDLIELTERLDLNDDISFLGALSGKELDEAYSLADIGLGALGNHRRKVFANSSLKAKEYATRGLLMIMSDAEGLDKEIKDCTYIVHSDESPIEFNEIIQWYQSISDPQKTKLEIRNYAMKNYSWHSQIEKILSFMNE